MLMVLKEIGYRISFQRARNYNYLVYNFCNDLSTLTDKLLEILLDRKFDMDYMFILVNCLLHMLHPLLIISI